MDKKTGQHLKPLTFWEIMGSTLTAALGIQTYENRQRDFTRGNVIHFIISGVVFVACFVIGMIAFVNFVIGQA